MAKMRKQKYYKFLYASRRRSMQMMLAKLFYILGHNSVCIKCILQPGKDKQKQKKQNSSSMHSAFASRPKRLKIKTGGIFKRELQIKCFFLPIQCPLSCV